MSDLNLYAIDAGAYINNGASVEPFTVIKRGTIVKPNVRVSS